MSNEQVTAKTLTDDQIREAWMRAMRMQSDEGDRLAADCEDALAILTCDGRYCAWESEQGPTSTGFSGDWAPGRHSSDQLLLGGAANVAFASKEVAALQHVSDSTRERMVRVALRRGGGS